MSAYFGEDVAKLGFGLMRLPRKGLYTDIAQVSEMVDLFLAAGCTYFDTAFIYLGSEGAAKKALVDRHPRESYTLATKLNVMMAPTAAAARRQLDTSLQRTGAGYFDYYLLHAIMDNNYQKYEKFGLWDFVQEQKAKGVLKHVGFSFHAGPRLLDRLLTQHPEVEFVQLQINYADWENPSVASRANYEVARKHNKSIVVMEPVKGGRLANPPAQVRALMEASRPDLSCAGWAIRFAASLEGIITVLSGMSNLAQMRDNLSFMRPFRPLDHEERTVIEQAQRLLGLSSTIPCTACHYCTAGCPKNIPIPEIFEAMNRRLGSGLLEEAAREYRQAVESGGRAGDCIGCGQCERVCPQRLEIIKHLGECARALS